MQTFLEHILITTGIDEEFQLNESARRPIGALITSIQAMHTPSYIVFLQSIDHSVYLGSFFQVHRILLYSIKGNFQPPALKPGGFSKANWGDYEVLSQ